MVDLEPAPWRHRPVPEAVAACVSAVTWSVATGRWDRLPADTAAMVAPPIVVIAAALASLPGSDDPQRTPGRHRSPVRAG